MVQPCQFWQKTLKSGRFLQQYCTRVPQNKGTKKEPVGAFHVVRLRRILLRLYLGLPLGAGRRAIDLPDKRGSLTDPYYCDRVSWMTHHNHVDHLGGVLFETHGTCVRQVYLRGSLNGLTWLLFCDSVTQDFLRFRQFMVPKRGSRLALNCQRSWGVVLFSAHYWHCVSPDGAACTAFWPQLCFFSQGP